MICAGKHVTFPIALIVAALKLWRLPWGLCVA